jgi:hypothetical protein
MTGTTVNGNTAAYEGGGLYLTGTPSTISGSTISNNSLTDDDSEGGGIYLHTGPLTVVTSTISGNTLASGTSMGGGIASWSSEGLKVISSTLSSNSAPSGGGIFISGPMTMTNSTLSANTAFDASQLGGGGLLVYNATTITLTNMTITSNTSASAGGGLEANHIYARVNMTNTLIAGNTAVTEPDCDNSGNATASYNLIRQSSHCAGVTNGINGNQVGTAASPLNPIIGTLANNGGSTLTHALLVGSPAIDAGNPTQATCPATDQRGTVRPAFTRCDIGAYEYNGAASPLPQISSLNPSSRMVGSGAFTLTVNGSNFIPSSTARWNGSYRTTTYINAGQLTVQILSSDISSLGTIPVTVFNGPPSGGISNSSNLSVIAAPYSTFLPMIVK